MSTAPIGVRNGGAYPAAHAGLVPTLADAATLAPLPPLTLQTVYADGSSSWVSAAGISATVAGPDAAGMTSVTIDNGSAAPVITLGMELPPGAVQSWWFASA